MFLSMVESELNLIYTSVQEYLNFDNNTLLLLLSYNIYILTF